MADDLAGLWAFHELAAQRGDGLKPELAALLGAPDRLARQGAIPLPARLKSSGPAPDPRQADAPAQATAPRVVKAR